MGVFVCHIPEWSFSQNFKLTLKNKCEHLTDLLCYNLC